MRLAVRPLAIDRARAARLLRDALHWLLAALPFLLGLLAGLLWRVLLLALVVVLWFVGAVLAGWDIGRGKRS